MKVLHLPINIATQMSVTVRALRDIGVDARGMEVGNIPGRDNRGVEVYKPISCRRHPIRGVLRTTALYRTIEQAIRWADVVHWHFNASVLSWNLDLRYAAWLGKARIVEFWGSDIRIPEIASADNPYVARMYETYPELADGVGRRSRDTQERFARYGFECLIPAFELMSYVQRDLFPAPYSTKVRLTLSEYGPRYPDPKEAKPLVIHSPTHKAKKGTDAVLKVIKELKKTNDFDFRLVYKVPKLEAVKIVQKCDVFLDQFVMGAHGLAALEAMAFGKPSVCYIKPSVVPTYPPNLPIVNANQDNLYEVLKGLLEDGQRRHKIGRRGRAYVEKYHDAHKIAHDLVRIYEELLEKVSSRKNRVRR